MRQKDDHNDFQTTISQRMRMEMEMEMGEELGEEGNISKKDPEKCFLFLFGKKGFN